MRFREIHPGWEAKTTDELLKALGHDRLQKLIGPIADWYRRNLPFWAVLRKFGYDGSRYGFPDIGPGTEEEQLSCIHPNHGSDDDRPSARYYQEDERDGSTSGHIYCWGAGCQRAYSSFWWLWAMAKSRQGYGYRQTILLIEEHFRVPFPKHIVLDADPDRLDDYKADEDHLQRIRAHFIQHRIIRNDVRPSDPGMALVAHAELYTQSVAPTPADD